MIGAQSRAPHACRIISMEEAVSARWVHTRHKQVLARIADGLALSAVVTLPWSTSIPQILLGLWLLVLLPTIDPAALRRELTTPAGGLPVVLFFFAALGMMWADASWAQRLVGLKGYLKLLIIPLLLVQFRGSDRGWQVVAAYLASITALLVLSWISAFAPALTPARQMPGVPVRDYIAQSGEFILCAFGLFYLAGEFWRRQRRGLAGLSVAAAVALFTNVAYVATSRTSLVVVPVLLAMLCIVRLRWTGRLAVAITALVIGVAVWESSPYLRSRVSLMSDELADHMRGGVETSGGQRLAFWQRSLTLIERAPVLGHGTEPIGSIFSRGHTNETGLDAVMTANPHNQVLAVALQLGVIGAGILVAMWVAHLLLFGCGGLVGWLGLVLVVQNVVSSLFNSHIFDFAQGWTYALGVGILGGMARRAAGFPAVLKPAAPP